MPPILDKLLRIGEGKILRQLEAVAKAVNAIEDDFVAMSDDELRGMTDEFRKRLLAIVRKKRKGGEIKLPEADAERTQPVPDLMKALEESLALHG